MPRDRSIVGYFVDVNDDYVFVVTSSIVVIVVVLVFTPQG
jgi:hypothetical protein